MRKNILLYGFILAIPFAIKLAIDALGGENWENSGLRRALLPIADLFLRTFNSPQTGIILSVTLLTLAFALILAFQFGKVQPIRRILKGAEARLIEPLGPEHDPVLHLRRAFNSTEEMTRIARQGIRAGEGRVNDETAATIRAGLNFSIFDRKGLTFGFYRQAPDFFVGAGLVFTFCGLVAGLFFASRGLMTADISLARDALNKLLSASTLKFMTSIGGVGGALLLNLSYRFGLDTLERARRSLLADLDDFVLTHDNRVAP